VIGPRATVRAAGAVLWRPAPAGLLIALVHRPRYDDWSLPKGKLDAGEHPLQAAVREVREETGHAGTVGRRLPTATYLSLDGPKAVDYWAMRAGAGQFIPGSEVDELAWLPTGEVLRKLSYAHDRDVVEDFTTLTPDTLVLVVRHARAGDRASWPGTDRTRPLDQAGSDQAARLAGVLPLFGPTRVISANRVRCAQTVAPLAERLGLAVDTGYGLTEESYTKDPAPALRLIRDLARTGRTSVLCGQGGVIPGVLATLATEDVLVLPHLRCRKGSVWALSFRAGLLVAADYYPDFEAAFC
jgi:8-oxo-(d)GTP phosphatase